MDELIKKIKALTASVKGLKSSPKAPSAPKVDISVQAPKPPVQGQESKKDAVKVSEQLADPKMRQKAVKVASKNRNKLNISKDGQWSLKL